MGSFIGHFFPGTAFTFFGLLRAFAILKSYFSKLSIQKWEKFDSSNCHSQPFEGFLVVCIFEIYSRSKINIIIYKYNYSIK